MTKCPSCGKTHRPGTLFCTRCGIYLPTGGALSTTPLPTDELPRSPSAPEAETDSEQVPGHGQELVLQVVESGRQFRVSIGSEVFLGREDAAHGILPDLDLTPDGGLEKGVSRRHAKIFSQGETFYIEDVGSANGTFLNDRRLTPYLPYSVDSGDRIQIGQLRFNVAIE
jgi:hypothetical protein